MTIIYPKHGMQKFPKDLHVIHSDDDVTLSQLEDTFVLSVHHQTDADRLAYDGYFRDGVHKISTNVDTNYHSKNLEFLIDVFTKYEEIWQSK
jgi:hypothetical protein